MTESEIKQVLDDLMVTSELLKDYESNLKMVKETLFKLNQNEQYMETEIFKDLTKRTIKKYEDIRQSYEDLIKMTKDKQSTIKLELNKKGD